jgi:hypothetical protein
MQPEVAGSSPPVRKRGHGSLAPDAFDETALAMHPLCKTFTVAELRHLFPGLVVAKVDVVVYRCLTGREQENEGARDNLEMDDTGDFVIRRVSLHVAVPSAEHWDRDIEATAGSGDDGGLVAFAEPLTALALHKAHLRSAYVQEHQKRPKTNKNGDLPAAYGTNPGGITEQDFEERDQVANPPSTLLVDALLLPAKSNQLAELKTRAEDADGMQDEDVDATILTELHLDYPLVFARPAVAKAARKLFDPLQFRTSIIAGVPAALPALLA